MDCSEIKNYLIDFVDKNLDVYLEKKIETHLDQCKDCREEIIQYKFLISEMEGFPRKNPGSKLEKHIDKLVEEEKSVATKKFQTIKPIRWFWVAAGIAIFLGGTFLGLALSKLQSEDNISNLKNEITNLKQIVIISMLKEESASNRIKAIGYINQIQNKSSDQIINSLINTFNYDESVNVKLSALNALIEYSDKDEVRKALIESLGMQENPLIQVTLVNLLVNLKETNAINQMKEVLNNPNTNIIVKKEVEKGIVSLI